MIPTFSGVLLIYLQIWQKKTRKWIHDYYYYCRFTCLKWSDTCFCLRFRFSISHELIVSVLSTSSSSSSFQLDLELSCCTSLPITSKDTFSIFVSFLSFVGSNFVESTFAALVPITSRFSSPVVLLERYSGLVSCFALSGLFSLSDAANKRNQILWTKRVISLPQIWVVILVL